MKVKLQTSAGDLVAEKEIPDFNEAPDVLIWGDRVFMRDDGHGDNTFNIELTAQLVAVYSEAFSYLIV